MHRIYTPSIFSRISLRIYRNLTIFLDVHYDSFCHLAKAFGASQSALAYRMEQLGLLDRNLLYKQ